MQQLLRNRVSGKLARTALAATLVLALGTVLTRTVQAQTFNVLYNFDGTHGANPYGTLLVGDGYLYGTTAGGGAHGNGTLFRVNIATGQEQVLHNFAGPSDGAGPTGRLRWDSGHFYGTTGGGGTYGYGTVFQMDSHATVTVLYNFAGEPDGANPYAGVIPDSAGNLYGTTVNGGASGLGTVFRLNIQTGQETVLCSFTDGASGTEPGENPYGALVLDRRGNLYGTTYKSNGFPAGSVFRLSASGKLTTLQAFTSAGSANGDALGPYGDLLLKNGIVYGTTVFGGPMSSGTIFTVDIQTGEYTLLFGFNQTNGNLPQAGVIQDAAGNLYGTTVLGTWDGCGSVFKLDTSGNLTTLYNFGAGGGCFPYAGLVMAPQGNLYGATYFGGNNNDGTIFEVVP
jgi:uncharacterized repeat protein (TIGR03803 family)